MNSNQLQKAINLAKKTGDRLIVFENPQSDSPFVVMNLDSYERMALGYSEVRDLTEEELIDKINRDIAIWKSEQDFDNIRKDDSWQSIWEDAGSWRERAKRKKGWAIPDERKIGAEEVEDLEDIEPEEEDRQYLEEI